MKRIQLIVFSIVLLLILMFACKDKTTEPNPPLIEPPDKTWPKVDSTYPAKGADSVNFDAVITIWFSEPIDRASFKPEYFWVNHGLPGTLTFPNSRTLRFQPTARLAPLTTYSLGLDPAIADTAGNLLSIPSRWSFTTRDLALDTAWTVALPDAAVDLLKVDDSTFAVLAGAELFYVPLSGEVAKQTTLFIPAGIRLQSFIAIGSGGFAAAGGWDYYGPQWIGTFDANGLLKFERSIAGSTDQGVRIKFSPSGSLLVSCMGGPDAMVLELDAELDSIWAAGAGDIVPAVAVLNDGGLIYTHISFRPFGNTDFARTRDLIRVSASRDHIWILPNLTGTFPWTYFGTTTLCQTADGNILDAVFTTDLFEPTYSALYKRSIVDGTILLERELHQNHDVIVTPAHANADNSFIVTGTGSSPSPFCTWYDALGNLTRELKGNAFFPGSTQLLHVEETPDGWLVLGDHSLTRLVLR